MVQLSRLSALLFGGFLTGLAALLVVASALARRAMPAPDELKRWTNASAAMQSVTAKEAVVALVQLAHDQRDTASMLSEVGLWTAAALFSLSILLLWAIRKTGRN